MSKKIMVVCGNGLGSSLMMEMAVKEVCNKNDFLASVDHEDLSSAQSSTADIWVAANDIGQQLISMGKENVVCLSNIFDQEEIKNQLSTYF